MSYQQGSTPWDLAARDVQRRKRRMLRIAEMRTKLQQASESLGEALTRLEATRVRCRSVAP